MTRPRKITKRKTTKPRIKNTAGRLNELKPVKRRKRPKFDEVRRKRYLRLIRDGGRRLVSARAVGVVYTTVWNHMQSNDKFAKAVVDAEIESNEKVETALFDAAISGNVTACQVWLYNRVPELWADKRNLQVTGKDGGPLEVAASVIGVDELGLPLDVRKLILEKIREKKEIIEVESKRLEDKSEVSGGKGI